MFDPEYVNIFGVPFTFLTTRSQDESVASEAAIAQDGHRANTGEGCSSRSRWPNIIRIEHVYRPKADSLDWESSGTPGTQCQ